MEACLEVESMTQLPSPPRYWGSAQMLGKTTSLSVEDTGLSAPGGQVWGSSRGSHETSVGPIAQDNLVSERA